MKYLTAAENEAYEAAMAGAANEAEEDKIIWHFVKINSFREVTQPCEIQMDKTNTKTFVFALAALIERA